MALLGAALLACCWLHLAAAGPSAAPLLWSLQRDDPSEYKETASFPAKGLVECVVRAEEAGASAAAFSASGSCSLFSCLLGEFGCRKCRNARNSSLPAFWLLQRKELNESDNFCWRTFQHRVDASVNFYRNWSEYVSGFGQGEDANFWMGLEQLHQLTKDAGRRVRWEFSDWNGTWYWSENPNFSVAGAADKFRASMGDFDSSRSSTPQVAASDLFSPNGKNFSTLDSDNDKDYGGSCAVEYRAGWWFGRCAFLNPNGKFYTPPTALNTASAPSRGIYFIFTAPNSPRPPPFVISYSMRTFECLLADSFSG